MNSKPISSYEDLCEEKQRLSELLKAQKVQIQRDIENLKDEFKPVLNLSEHVSKLLSREDGKDPLVTAGTNITIDILVAKLLGKSNFLLKLILPAILKNLTSHYLPNAHVNKKPSLYGPAMEKTVVQKTVVVRQENKAGEATMRKPATEERNNNKAQLRESQPTSPATPSVNQH